MELEVHVLLAKYLYQKEERLETLIFLEEKNFQISSIKNVISM